MAVKRGKSQARRNNGHRGGLPGWAWLVLGIIIALVAVVAAPRFLKSDGDGFIRPHPNPDAEPVATRGDDDAVVPDSSSANGVDDGSKPGAAQKPGDKEPQYDFYTLLPGQEVAMSDAELAASAQAEAVRQRKLVAQQQAQQAGEAAQAPAGATTAETTPADVIPPAGGASDKPTVAAATDNQAHYLLQAGAFGASGDAEALKARIALLGLNARVESAAINDKTVYRVRMGPYGTATELADAKSKLSTGGLPAMAIKAK